MLWYVLVPLRTHYWFIVPFAVLLQEAMRWAFYKLYAYVPAPSRRVSCRWSCRVVRTWLMRRSTPLLVWRLWWQ
jgi:hypothetical protein